MKKLSIIVLVILAILSAIVAVVYFSKTAGNLPHFYPGYTKGSTHKHLKHGVVFIGLAVVFLLGAWMASGHSSSDTAASKQSPKTDS
jgi:amino acid permease